MDSVTRREFMKAGLFGAYSLALPGGEGFSKSRSKRWNVLFIAVDDLRCELGCYGKKLIRSPNIDALAGDGLLFERAYCQQAVCSPSRTSLLTGLRPDSTGVWDLVTYFRDTIPDVVTLPQLFRMNGYYCESIGKIFHSPRMQDDGNSWSVPSRRGMARGFWQTPEHKRIRETLIRRARRLGLRGKRFRHATLGPPWDDADVPDEWYPDGLTAKWAVESLRRIAGRKEPFFLAVGFIKPHLPFSSPRRYWELYDPMKLPLPERTGWPDGMPEIAGTDWWELRHYYGMPKHGPLSMEQTRKLIHGYYAAVSYMDAQLGKVLRELKRLGLYDNTVIILWGDHGWKLGEYGAWCKHTNFELDTHAPLILKVPGYEGGRRTRRLVEFLDIYPTLADSCGLEIPYHCEGKSMRPLLEDPEAKFKGYALSQYPRGGMRIMGYSLRTDEWRYVEWMERRTRKVAARELYDHRTNRLEARNLAEDERYSDVVKRHEDLLHGILSV